MNKILEKVPVALIVLGGVLAVTGAFNAYLGLAVCGVLLVVWGIAFNLVRCGESNLAGAFCLVGTMLVISVAMVAYFVADHETAWTLSMIFALVAGAMLARFTTTKVEQDR